MKVQNKTKVHAKNLIRGISRLASSGNPTSEYLLALQQAVEAWRIRLEDDVEIAMKKEESVKCLKAAKIINLSFKKAEVKEFFDKLIEEISSYNDATNYTIVNENESGRQ